jgi:hypothetical protein
LADRGQRNPPMYEKQESKVAFGARIGYGKTTGKL